MLQWLMIRIEYYFRMHSLLYYYTSILVQHIFLL